MIRSVLPSTTPPPPPPPPPGPPGTDKCCKAGSHSVSPAHHRCGSCGSVTCALMSTRRSWMTGPGARQHAADCSAAHTRLEGDTAPLSFAAH